jgi:vanillate O-demethylase monooxygenase subunit
LLDCWHLAARSDQIRNTLPPLSIAEQSIILARAFDCAVAALADRGAHRPYSLSLGRLIDDRIIAGLDGVGLHPRRQCVHVPSQTLSSVDAQVRTYPVNEQHDFIDVSTEELHGSVVEHDTACVNPDWL